MILGDGPVRTRSAATLERGPCCPHWTGKRITVRSPVWGRRIGGGMVGIGRGARQIEGPLHPTKFTHVGTPPGMSEGCLLTSDLLQLLGSQATDCGDGPPPVPRRLPADSFGHTSSFATSCSRKQRGGGRGGVGRRRQGSGMGETEGRTRPRPALVLPLDRQEGPDPGKGSASELRGMWHTEACTSVARTYGICFAPGKKARAGIS